MPGLPQCSGGVVLKAMGSVLDGTARVGAPPLPSEASVHYCSACVCVCFGGGGGAAAQLPCLCYRKAPSACHELLCFLFFVTRT